MRRIITLHNLLSHTEGLGRRGKSCFTSCKTTERARCSTKCPSTEEAACCISARFPVLGSPPFSQHPSACVAYHPMPTEAQPKEPGVLEHPEEEGIYCGMSFCESELISSCAQWDSNRDLAQKILTTAINALAFKALGYCECSSILGGGIRRQSGPKVQ